MREIASEFEEGLSRIREKYNKVGYPIRFVNSVISSFTNDNPTPQPRDINKMSINKFTILSRKREICKIISFQIKHFYRKQIYIFNPVEDQEITVTFPIKG